MLRVQEELIVSGGNILDRLATRIPTWIVFMVLGTVAFLGDSGKMNGKYCVANNTDYD